MPKFVIESKLKVEPDTLAAELFSIAAVNQELSPIVHMSAPRRWQHAQFTQVTPNEFLFRSWITLFRFLPVDLHHLRFSEVGKSHFKESSTSWLHRYWRHERIISRWPGGALVRDEIDYISRIGPLGYMLLPVFTFVFRHRHRKLKSSYGELR